MFTMTREDIDTAIFNYVKACGLDPVEFDYEQFNLLLDEIDGAKDGVV